MIVPGIPRGPCRIHTTAPARPREVPLAGPRMKVSPPLEVGLKWASRGHADTRPGARTRRGPREGLWGSASLSAYLFFCSFTRVRDVRGTTRARGWSYSEHAAEASVHTQPRARAVHHARACAVVRPNLATL